MTAEPIRARVRRSVRHEAYGSFTGAVLATGFVAMSLTPSLLPRTWLVQGLISGVSAVTGYAIGALLGRLLRRFTPRPRIRRYSWYALVGLGVPLVSVLTYQSSRWQRDLYAMMAEPPPTRIGYVRLGLVTCAVFVLFLALARVLRAGARAATAALAPYFPPRSARVAGAVLAVLVFAGGVDALVYDPAISVAFELSASVNDELSPLVAAPASGLRSGGPGSAVSWASLGLEGRNFVAGGPTVGQLLAFSHTAPRQPVRVYAGLLSAPSIDAEAALAVRELRRTGAFDRRVLCVVTTTGTGWVDPRAAEALEYLYNGDSAEVAVQYSYLPSWLTYLVERKKVETAGQALFDAVYGYWSTLPPDHRPRLLMFGESLGTLGGEAAIHDLTDLRGRVDGILWAGPVADSRLWSGLVADRDRGTREVDPSYQQGRTVRFATGPADLADLAMPWPGPRVLYLQHASDPITWWSPMLALRAPDWLREPRGPDVLPTVRWYPFVTFWQVTADLIVAQDTTLGHGHRYGGELATAWAAIAPPAGWTASDTTRLVRLVNAHG